MQSSCISIFLLISLLSSRCLGQGDYFKSRQYIHPGLPGPWIHPTKGQVWPKPHSIKNNGQRFSLVNAADFQFKLDHHSSKCDLIVQAAHRYRARLFPKRKQTLMAFDESHPWFNTLNEHPDFAGKISSVEIVMQNNRGCKEKYPSMDMDENYEIKVDTPEEPNAARIISFSAWGILRGLETFSQLVFSETSHGGMYEIRSTQIMDHPRFSWRGIMLDSSRHFLSLRALKDNLDLMEMNKMNVFHWHLTDDNSFPYQSFTFPQLSAKGAYNPRTHVYSQADVREIVEYARLRGIRVVSEFDTPGHTEAWGLGMPELLTKCYRGHTPNGLLGPMNPTNQTLYDILTKFFKEVTTVFPDKYVHLGGDEVDLECWQSNPELQQYVKKHLHGNFRQLEAMHFKKLLQIIEEYPSDNGYIVWQEVFDNQDKVKDDTVVHVWKGGEGSWKKTVSKITKSGYRALLSAPWYLNYISYGADWVKYYQVDPEEFTATDNEKRLLMGGEACMWGEFVNSVNLLPRLWPRASAIAERLWSPIKATRDPKAAAPRLQEMECRMLTRGFPVEPANGPGFCEVAWDDEEREQQEQEELYEQEEKQQQARGEEETHEVSYKLVPPTDQQEIV